MRAVRSAISQHRQDGWVVLAVTAVAFLLCFGPALVGLVRAWLTVADAAHGLLIAPVAVWLAIQKGLTPTVRPALWSGGIVLVAAVALYVIGRGAGVDTAPHVALILAIIALIACQRGWRQVQHWGLPLLVLALTIPLPASLVVAATLPLQGTAARIGATMLEWRHVPVALSGNIIRVPGHVLFVSEACSGLRSLTALLCMAVLVGALFLERTVHRIAIVILAIVLAIVMNGVRVFLTGFLVYFVDPKLGEGFMHLTEGYLFFLVSLAGLAVLTVLFIRIERRREARGA